MKNLILFTLLSTSLLLANEQNSSTTGFSNYLTQAVKSVEDARKEALKALNSMVENVTLAREKNPPKESVTSKIAEIQAIAQIAKSTAKVEIAKTKAIATISHALDAVKNASEGEKEYIKNRSLKVIANAIASVEIAKANASKNIVKATEHVEISKTLPTQEMINPEASLKIAKNTSAVTIAKSVYDAEIEKIHSLSKMAQSSIKEMKDKFITPENKKRYEALKAEATANISTYLAKIEILKAEMLSKIAKEVAKVEVAKSHLDALEKK